MLLKSGISPLRKVQYVTKKQVLALLETMKVFQKVKSPVNGKVVEILVDDATPVSDNHVLLVIEEL